MASESPVGFRTSLTRRLWGAARLDVRAYEEVEADESALRQALGIVVASSVAAGIGHGGYRVTGILVGAAIDLAGWFLWAGLTYWIGTRLLPEEQTEADVGQLLRTIGFAATPGLLRVLGIVPGLGEMPIWIAGAWMLAANFVAVRQALDYTSSLRTLAVCSVGFALYAPLSLATWVIGFFGSLSPG
jgi:hypothetical protein